MLKKKVLLRFELFPQLNNLFGPYPPPPPHYLGAILTSQVVGVCLLLETAKASYNRDGLQASFAHTLRIL